MVISLLTPLPLGVKKLMTTWTPCLQSQSLIYLVLVICDIKGIGLALHAIVFDDKMTAITVPIRSKDSDCRRSHLPRVTARPVTATLQQRLSSLREIHEVSVVSQRFSEERELFGLEIRI